MLIIGITGTLGAGKGTIVEYLVSNKGFKHLSVRGYLIEEIIKMGLTVNRDSMVLIANQLRKENSPSYIIDRLYEQAVSSNENCIIESIRTPGEVNALKAKGNFFLLAVDANPVIRYDRIYLRNSETDNISFETFIQNEKREMDSTDPNHQNIRKCMQAADYVFNNDGTIDTLEGEINNVLKEIMEKYNRNR